MDIGRKWISEEPGGPASSPRMEKTAPYVCGDGGEEARERGAGQRKREGHVQRRGGGRLVCGGRKRGN